MQQKSKNLIKPGQYKLEESGTKRHENIFLMNGKVFGIRERKKQVGGVKTSKWFIVMCGSPEVYISNMWKCGDHWTIDYPRGKAKKYYTVKIFDDPTIAGELIIEIKRSYKKIKKNE